MARASGSDSIGYLRSPVGYAYSAMSGDRTAIAEFQRALSSGPPARGEFDTRVCPGGVCLKPDIAIVNTHTDAHTR